ncbi:Autoinducer 2 sensor kinase-phosphatase LuxQ protein [Marine Group I thaumarchaeote SCGC AAA799-B03]|uniref:histidine kinase n=3 Tax=Marine Group I TaxID=905826 RepID=A0A087S7S8_9ARCH|nr:Autoinducer 2 sensor kinase-phosphatase LuxQ protein [Marine Group I thaumarchaeote SCGC AAA799-D11]KFM17950.1 Sensor protein SrrB [Marine Group I thaumarchaeote SCGC RSA3]KFM21782.1 Autoinducer 2 sensor kinase-phosphatase LuxQ protein [Marine Group I thaumarchaeote SCGC AAA799-B03]
MLKIKHVLFLMFGVTSFIIFYMGFLNYITTEDQTMGLIMLTFSGIVSIGALIGTFYVSRKITTPIESVIDKMNKFSTTTNVDEDFLPHNGIKELHFLHENFKNMTGIVSDTIKKERKVNKQLQDMDKRKVEFMSMVSHELKTPLMPILGYIQLLKKEELLGKLNPQQLDAINEIDLAITRLQKLVQDVLIVQKIDLEKLTVTNSNIDSEKIVNTAYNAFLPICNLKGVKLGKNLDANHNLVSDPDRINQVFSNLISNAIEFVPKNNPEIEIGAYDEENQIVFFVKDNGAGISNEEQKNIFKKFYQIDATSKRKKEGSGLGLAICEGIVKKLGGKIGVKSEIGKGTMFYFALSKEKIQVQNF